jgi:hypothetical protein
VNSPYRSYLLRLWLEPNANPAWRVMVESPANGERHGFSSLESFIAFLQQEMKEMERGSPNTTSSDPKNP